MSYLVGIKEVVGTLAGTMPTVLSSPGMERASWAGMTLEHAASSRQAGHLAGIFSSLKTVGLAERVLFNDILQRVLLANSRLLGVWTVWEPGALDGRDGEFAGTPGHDDTGRFVPFWHRYGGGLHLQPNTDYDKPTADWYLRPSRSGRQTVIDPYEYVVRGEKLFIASQVAPIHHEGRCVGVVGIDVHLDSLLDSDSHFASVEAVLDRGYVLLDAGGEVRHWSEATRRLLRRYAGGRGAGLPGDLQLAIRRKLAGDPSARQAVWRFSRGNLRLVLRLVHHPHADCHFLLVEEQAAGGASAWELSPREQEVARWMGEGKSNEEIAIILGISIHTVKNHLEKVFRKLGVENRHAASLMLHAALPELQAA